MKTVSLSDFSKICRLCLSNKHVSFIPKIKRKKVVLSELIFTYASIEVKKNDEKPKNICKICLDKIYSTYNFTLKCKEVETTLNNVLLRSKASLKDELDDVPLIELIEVKREKKEEVANVKLEGSEEESDNDAQVESLTNNFKVELQGDPDSEVELKTAGEELQETVTNKKEASREKSTKKYSCKVCNIDFDDSQSAKQHRIEFKHMREKKHKCSTCGKSFLCNYRLNEHIRTHTGERPNVCDQCNKRFNSKSDLKRHVVIIHLNIKRYKCAYCDNAFSRKFYLRDHERTHTGERLYSSCCAKEFTSYYSLYHHEKKHKYNRHYQKKDGPPKQTRQTAEIDVKGQQFPCHLCPKVLRTDYSLRRHVSVKHDLRNLTCDDCGETFGSIRLLNEHIRTTHKDHPYTLAHLRKDYECLACNKQFKYKASYRDHMRVHSGDLRFKCSSCDKVCLNKRKLGEHTRIHTGEKPFTCSFCGKCFRTLTNMAEHQKTHNAQRSHPCTKCDKSFFDARTLRKHQLAHGDKVLQAL